MRQVLIGLLVALTSFTASASILLTKIVDTDTLVPGTDEPFVEFHRNIAFEGDTVVFAGAWGTEGDEHFGLFAFDGTFTTIVDENTPIPDGEGNFTMAGLPALAGGQLAFLGFQLDEDNFPTQSGIYHVVDGELETIVAQNTPIPGAEGTFTFLNNVARSEQVIAFQAQGVDHDGVYAWSEDELTVAADENTTVPGTTVNFTGFGTPAVDGNALVFIAVYWTESGDPGGGIYSTAGGLDVVVDNTTLVPGTSNPFYAFQEVAASDGAIAFTGTDRWWQSHRGVYTTRGGLRTVAEREMPAPGGSYTFRSFGQVAMEADVIAFRAFGEDAFGNYIRGLYAEIRHTLVKVIDSADPLDGKAIRNLGTGPNALDGNRVALRVEFEDESQALYVATICLGDLNGDGIVDESDLIELLNNYGSSDVPIDDGDINGDGVVNLSDLAILLSNFGQTCW